MGCSSSAQTNTNKKETNSETKVSHVAVEDNVDDSLNNDNVVAFTLSTNDENRENTLVAEFSSNVVDVEPDEDQNEHLSSQNQNLDVIVTRKVSQTPSIKTDDGLNELEETDERAKKDVLKLHEANEGVADGLAEEYLTLLVPVSDSYRQLLRKVYKDQYDRDLIADLDIESTGELKYFFKNLLRTPEEFVAHWFHGCVKTRQYATMIEILTAWSPMVISNAKNTYLTDFKISLEEDIENCLDDLVAQGIKDVVKPLASLQRNDESKELDENLTKSEADELSKGNDNFIEVVLNKKHSKAQLAAIFKDYKIRYYLDVSDSIEINFDDETAELLQIIVNIAEDSANYFAKEVNKALVGSNRDTQRLLMLLIGRHQVDLARIVSNYKELYDKSIEDDIDSKCSSHYRNAFKLLITKFGC